MSPALMCALALATASTYSGSVMLAAAFEKPSCGANSMPPRSAFTISARSRWRSLSVPECSSATRRAVELAVVRRQALEKADDVVARGADEAAVERNAVDRRRELGRSRERVAHQREPFAGILRAHPRLTVDDEPIGM